MSAPSIGSGERSHPALVLVTAKQGISTHFANKVYASHCLVPVAATSIISVRMIFFSSEEMGQKWKLGENGLGAWESERSQE